MGFRERIKRGRVNRVRIAWFELVSGLCGIRTIPRCLVAGPGVTWFMPQAFLPEPGAVF